MLIRSGQPDEAVRTPDVGGGAYYSPQGYEDGAGVDGPSRRGMQEA
jgi:hypothetical protein